MGRQQRERDENEVGDAPSLKARVFLRDMTSRL